MNISPQLKLYLTDVNNTPVYIPENKRRKHYKKPSYKRIERVDKLDLNYLTLRKLYVEISNYCPKPLKFNGYIPDKIDIEGVVTLWCTEYSRDDEFATEQLPSVYYEAEINNTWNLKLFDKIRLHSDLLELLKKGELMKNAVKKSLCNYCSSLGGAGLSLLKQAGKKREAPEAERACVEQNLQRRLTAPSKNMTKNFTDGAR